MRRQKHSVPNPLSQPLPVSEIRRNARHGKTPAHLPEPGDLPIELLEKEIPKTDLHDM